MLIAKDVEGFYIAMVFGRLVCTLLYSLMLQFTLLFKWISLHVALCENTQKRTAYHFLTPVYFVCTFAFLTNW